MNPLKSHFQAELHGKLLQAATFQLLKKGSTANATSFDIENAFTAMVDDLFSTNFSDFVAVAVVELAKTLDKPATEVEAMFMAQLDDWGDDCCIDSMLAWFPVTAWELEEEEYVDNQKFELIVGTAFKAIYNNATIDGADKYGPMTDRPNQLSVRTALAGVYPLRIGYNMIFDRLINSAQTVKRVPA